MYRSNEIGLTTKNKSEKPFIPIPHWTNLVKQDSDYGDYERINWSNPFL